MADKELSAVDEVCDTNVMFTVGICEKCMEIVLMFTNPLTKVVHHIPPEVIPEMIRGLTMAVAELAKLQEEHENAEGRMH